MHTQPVFGHFANLVNLLNVIVRCELLSFGDTDTYLSLGWSEDTFLAIYLSVIYKSLNLFRHGRERQVSDSAYPDWSGHHSKLSA